MIEAVNSAAAGNALLVCKDEETRELLVQSLRALAIRSEICEEVFSAAALIESHKFEAVIVDLKMGEQAAEVMERLRHSPANRTAVTAIRMVQVTSSPPSCLHVLCRPVWFLKL